MIFSLNKKVDKMIQDIAVFIMNNISDLAKEAEIEEPGFWAHNKNEILGLKVDDTNLMSTISKALYKNDDESKIIIEMKSVITMPISTLYETMLTAEMDMENIKRTIHLTLRHEIGHIVDFQRFIGKPCSEWNDYLELDKSEKNLLPHLRKNASLKSRLDHFLLYHHTTLEDRADSIAGITDEDWINDFRLLSGCKNWRIK